MSDTTARVHPAGPMPGTSWIAVGAGVLVTMGVAALLMPILSPYLALSTTDLTGAGSAVPVVASLALAAFLGGYIAGRVAKRRAGWHGLLSGFVGLLLTGSYLLVSVAVQQSYFGIDDRVLPEFFPMVLTRSQYHSEASLALGLIGLPVQIVAAWIGGLFARPRPAVVASARVVEASAGPAPRSPAVGSPGAVTQR
jgi:putative membrane protein (TIGR04086 family)